MENNNVYQVKKAIRFKLQPAESNSVNLSEAIEGNVEFNLPNFVVHLVDFYDDLNEFFFYEDEDRWLVKEKMVVKKEWLQENEKEAYLKWKREKKDKENKEKVDVSKNKRVQLTIENIDG